MELTREEIRSILAGNRMAAIQQFRLRTNCALLEAKHAVEAFMREVGLVKKTECGFCRGRGYMESFAVKAEVKIQ